MAFAEARSQEAGRDLIDCADLLVGLARVGRGVAARILTDAGFDASEDSGPKTPGPEGSGPEGSNLEGSNLEGSGAGGDAARAEHAPVG